MCLSFIFLNNILIFSSLSQIYKATHVQSLFRGHPLYKWLWQLAIEITPKNFSLVRKLGPEPCSQEL